MTALIGISIVLILTLGVGLAPAFSRKAKQALSVNEYFLGSRGMGPVVLFFTSMATWYSSSLFLGAVAEVYAKGIGWIFAFTSTAISGLVFYFIAPRMQALGQRHQFVTQADFFAHRFDSRLLGLLVGLVGTVCMIPYITIQVVGVGLIFEIFTDGLVPFWLGALIAVAVCALFIYFGGMTSVAWTDVLLGIVFVTSIWFVVGMILFDAFGGFGSFFEAARTRVPELLTLPGPKHLEWGYFLSQTWVIGLGGYMWPHLYMRMVAARSARDARRVGSLITLASVPSQLPVVLGALAAAILIPSLASPDTALISLIGGYAPLWTIAILGAGGIAASLSTINSLAHSQGVTVAQDLYLRLVRTRPSESRIIAVSRAFVLITCVIAYAAALTKPTFLWTILANTYSGVIQFFPLMIAALFWSKATREGAIAALIVGLVTALLFSYVIGTPWGIVAPAWGFVANVLTLIVVSLLTQSTRDGVGVTTGSREAT